MLVVVPAYVEDVVIVVIVYVGNYEAMAFLACAVQCLLYEIPPGPLWKGGVGGFMLSCDLQGHGGSLVSPCPRERGSK